MGNIRKQVAHLPQTADPNDSEVQETAYVCAASTAGGSLLDSNSLLSEVRYPDESTGLAGTGRAYQVLYTYDRLGDLRSVEDQNQTRHTYSRDGAGRVTLDAVWLAPGSAIDDWVLSMGVAYDDFGRLSRVTSYTDPSGSSVKNQAEFAYSPLWQIMHVYQDHDGAVTYDGGGVPMGNTRRVQYSYSSAVVDAGNRSRLSSLTYPDGSIFDHSYGATARDIDDHISRLTRMKINGEAADLVAYEHVGLGMIAAVDYPTADIQLDRTASHAGYRRTQSYQTQPEGWYPGWDRFGRVKKQAWVDGAYTSGLGGNPSVPPLVELEYTYDRASNRLSMTDARPGASWSDRDFAYSYDGLDRLAQADRGVKGGSWSAAVGGQKWALDMLGNWETMWRDNDGDGVYESTEDQTRTHNAANEVVDLTPVTGPPALPFAYDEAGNMTESPNQSGSATMYYKHDAWNRLTEVNVGATPLGEYEYNALHWRTVKRSRDPVVGGPGMDEMRLMYYSANWQLLEERIDRGWTSGFAEDERAQTFWGKRYIDDAVLRRRDRDLNSTYEHAFHYLSDAQFSTVAMVDSSNARVVERNSYDAYGKARHHFGGDVNNDAAATYADDNAIVATMNAGNNSIGKVNYKVEQDLNRDGLINLNDRLTLQALTGNSVQPALPSGQVSFRSTGSGASIIHGPDSPIAWDGYVFNPETLQYTVRFRWYDPSLGRWLERDPAGYIEGPNLFEYVNGWAGIALDPFGLAAEPPGYTPPRQPIEWHHRIPKDFYEPDSYNLCDVPGLPARDCPDNGFWLHVDDHRYLHNTEKYNKEFANRLDEVLKDNGFVTAEDVYKIRNELESAYDIVRRGVIPTKAWKCVCSNDELKDLAEKVLQKRQLILKELAEQGVKKGIKSATAKGAKKAARRGMVLVGQALGIVGTGGVAGAILLTYEACDATIFVITTVDELLSAVADPMHRKWLEARLRENEFIERGDPQKVDEVLDAEGENVCAGSIQRVTRRDCDENK